MQRIILYILLCGSLLPGAFRAGAQSAEIANLRSSLPFAKDSMAYVDMLNQLGMYYHLSNIDSCFLLATKAREIAVRLHYKRGEAGALKNLGIVYGQQFSIQQAIAYEKAAMALYLASGDSANVCHMMNNLSIDYEAEGNKPLELYYEQQAMAWGSRLSNDSMYSLVLSNYIIKCSKDSTKQHAVKWAYDQLRSITARYPYSREWLYARMFEAVTLLKQGHGEQGEVLINKVADTAIQKGFLHLGIAAYFRVLDDFIPMGYPADSVLYAAKIFKLSQRAGYYELMMKMLPYLYRHYEKVNDADNIAYYGNGLRQLALHQLTLQRQRGGINYLEYFMKEQEMQSLQLRNQVQQQAIERSNLERVTRRILIWFLAALLVLLIGITIVYYRYYRNSRRYELRVDNMNKSIAEKNRLLRSNDDFKNKLISVIAHDFRDPLNNIIRMAAMLQAHSLDKPSMEQLTSQIADSAAETLAVFDNILRWIKSQLSGFIYAPAPCNIYSMMTEALPSIQHAAQEKKVSISIQVPDDIQVAAEREMLQFVHRSLLNSAIGFSTPGGQVQVLTTEEAGAVKVWVKVLQINITAAMLPHLFEYRGTSYYKGFRRHDAELALVICKDFMDKMGGHISAAPEKQGFAFVYELPSFH